jgi:hypothetical protein
MSDWVQKVTPIELNLCERALVGHQHVQFYFFYYYDCWNCRAGTDVVPE